MTVDPAAISRILRQLTACRDRNDDLATKVVQLTQSRERWKAKATVRGNELRRLRRKPPLRPSRLEYGPDVVAQILNIPIRDIE